MLFLTYWPSRPDSAGQQLQRILGIYALSRYLDCGYVHTLMVSLNYHGFISMITDTPNPSLVARYNELFVLPSSPLPLHTADIYFSEPTLENLKLWKRKASGVIEPVSSDTIRLSSSPPTRDILLHITYPHEAIDNHPTILEYLPSPLFEWQQEDDESPSLLKDIELNPISSDHRTITLHQSSSSPRRDLNPQIRHLLPLTIAIHYRRGELIVVDQHKLLPFDYYKAVIMFLHKLLSSNGRNHRFHIHTEAPAQIYEITPNHFGVNGRLKTSTNIYPEHYHLDEFINLPRTTIFENADPVWTLKQLARADILMMSHSSFSYDAATHNRSGVILYHPYWHNKMPQWLLIQSSTDLIPLADKIIAMLPH